MTTWPQSSSFIVPPHAERFGFGGKLATARYLDRLAAYSRAAEGIGVTGAFIYDFPVALDPWLAAFDVMAGSPVLEPIVAVRPHQETPESAARRLVDLGYRFGRPAHVNVVSGATAPARAGGDLVDRVAARKRLGEWAAEVRIEIDRRHDGACARPQVYTPLSSTAGLVPADCVLLMARPRAALGADIARARAEQQVERIAMLVGVVARETPEEAWSAAVGLHAPDRRQEVAGRLFASQVVSSEHLSSYALAARGEVHDEYLWYGAPMRGIDAPKLVGSVPQLTGWLRSCADLGVTDLIIDLAADPGEYAWTGRILAGLH